MITASYSPTWKDQFQGTVLHLKLRTFRRSTRMLGCFLFLIWAVTLWQPHQWTLLYASLPLVAILMTFGHYIAAGIGSLAAQKLTHGKTYDFAFTPEHYKIQSPGSEATVSWSNVLEVILHEGGFLICPNKYVGIWVPRHSFQGDAGDVRFTDLLKTIGVVTRAV